GLVHEGGLIYFYFRRRFFGSDGPVVAYQFGRAVLNAPFYLASQLVAGLAGFDHYHSGEIAIAVASNLATVGSLYFGWRILQALDLPRGAAVLLLTLFGTPLYYYGALWVGYKHAADTLYATALFWFVLCSTRDGARRRVFAGAGICLGLALVTRYANFALLLGVLAVFSFYRLWRAAAWMLVATAATSAVLLIAPVVRHVPYASPPTATALAGDSTDRPTWSVPVRREAMGSVNP